MVALGFRPMKASKVPQISIQITTFAAEGPSTWRPMLDRARAADAAGIDRLVVSDHVVFGENLDAYASPELGGTAGGRQPTGPDGHWLEPLTVLSVIAGLTSSVRLGTNILLAALRRPAVLAKTAATLDVLSEGRLDLGVGVGWQREEYVAAGLDFEQRGALLEHSLRVCQALWREQSASIDDAHLSFDNIHAMPKPLQPRGVPLWISGTVNPRVIRRVATFGSGWIPWGPSAADITTGIAKMRDGLLAIGHDPADLMVVGNLGAAKNADGSFDLPGTIARVPTLVAAGVTDVRAALPIPADPSAAQDFLSAVVAAFGTAVGR